MYNTERVSEGPIYVVKTIKSSRSEAKFYELLDPDSDSPADHNIPQELIRCERPLVVIPFVGDVEAIIGYKPALCLQYLIRFSRRALFRLIARRNR